MSVLAKDTPRDVLKLMMLVALDQWDDPHRSGRRVTVREVFLKDQVINPQRYSKGALSVDWYVSGAEQWIAKQLKTATACDICKQSLFDCLHVFTADLTSHFACEHCHGHWEFYGHSWILEISGFCGPLFNGAVLPGTPAISSERIRCQDEWEIRKSRLAEP